MLGGVGKFDGTTWKVYDNTTSSLPDNNINVITVDGNNNIWIGTSNGLSKFDGSTWTNYNTSNSGLLDNYISAIAIDQYGNKWIGTIQGGLTVFNESGIVSGTEKLNNNIRSNFSLSQNFPNPFNPSTVINYELSKAGIVSIKVFDILGREVRTIASGYKSAGKYSVNFDASKLASGVYVYQLSSNGFVSTKKMMLLK
jgi:hypothetical protein